MSQCHDGWNLVDPVAEAVSGAQSGLVLIGQMPVLAGFDRPGEPADGCERLEDLVRVTAPEGGDGVHQGGVGGGHVVTDQRRGLVLRYTL